MSVGLRIKTKREELGLSQEELAKRIGYKSRSSINKIELGINDIKQSQLIKFAEALQTTTSYLMGLEAVEPTDKILKSVILNKQEQHLISNYNNLNSKGRKKLLDYSDDLLTSIRYSLSEDETFIAANTASHRPSSVIVKENAEISKILENAIAVENDEDL